MKQSWKQIFKALLGVLALASLAYLVSVVVWTGSSFAMVKNPNCDPNIGDCKLWLTEIEVANILGSKGYEPGALEWSEDADQEGRFCVNNECGYGFQETKVIVGKDKDSYGNPTAKADNRVAVNKSEHKIHSGIGRTKCLNSDGQVFIGTAFLAVEHDVVVSDLHSFFDGTRRREVGDIVKDCKFILTDVNGNEHIHMFESGEIGNLDKLHADVKEKTNDWAVLKLTKSASSHFTAMGTLELDAKSLAKWARTRVIGYAGDEDKDPNTKYSSKGWLKNTKIDGAGYPVLEHTADTNGGTSGAPLIHIIDGEPYFFGIHVSHSRYDRNIGLALDGEFKRALDRATN